MLSREILDELARPLDPRRIAVLNDGPARGAKYLPGADVLYTANRIFGFGGWSYDVVTSPYVLSPGEADGKNEVWACVVRVTIDGASYADMGTCVRSGRGANAVEMAAKGSVTDGIKRAFTALGDQFGLVLRDKSASGADIERWWEEEAKAAKVGAQAAAHQPQQAPHAVQPAPAAPAPAQRAQQAEAPAAPARDTTPVPLGERLAGPNNWSALEQARKAAALGQNDVGAVLPGGKYTLTAYNEYLAADPRHSHESLIDAARDRLQQRHAQAAGGR